MNPAPPRGANNLILPIQYLRGIAAILVVWFHATIQVDGVSTYFSSSFGASGVDLFFVISGFIMVVTTAGKDVTPQRFFVLRIIRVVPLYWLATLAGIARAAHA